MGFFSRLVGSRAKASIQQSAPDNTSGGRALRQMLLTTPPAEFGVAASDEFPHIYGILMDWSIGEAIATIFSSSSGAASLYTTSTFGIIGGEGHAAVRNAAIRFVRAADRLYASATPTREFPYPADSRIRFYLLGYEGVRVIETDMSSVEAGTNKYSRYFGLGQEVLSQLRLICEPVK